MAFDLTMESLRERVGLESTDTSKDPEIEAARDSALAMMGNYCDRIFLESTGDEEFVHKAGDTLSLRRYPVSVDPAVESEDQGEITEFHLDAEAGLILLDYYAAFHKVTVTVTGGYTETGFPADLLMAFYAAFDQEYALVEGGTASGAEIESVTVADVGTVRYNVSSASDDAGSYLPARSKSILEIYKRYQC